MSANQAPLPSEFAVPSSPATAFLPARTERYSSPAVILESERTQSLSTIQLAEVVIL